MASDADDFGGLYPFLYASEGNVEHVLAEVRRSTAEKAAETLALRERMIAEYGETLLDCALACATSLAGTGRVFAFGNGGSSTDAQGLVEVLLNPPYGRAVPATSLVNDVATVTALANDVSFEVVFARPIAAAGRQGDIAVGFSTSGGSDNVIAGFEAAARAGLITVGFAGSDGGRMVELAETGTIDHLFVVPTQSIHRIQESHTTIAHLWWELVQQVLAQSAPATSGAEREAS